MSRLHRGLLGGRLRGEQAAKLEERDEEGEGAHFSLNPLLFKPSHHLRRPLSISPRHVPYSITRPLSLGLGFVYLFSLFKYVVL